ncbi:MAG: hypothetical protein QOI21_3078 [Actinomycetota bacterium]|nr:hypothetical protein [Actinomycetota bacterium]
MNFEYLITLPDPTSKKYQLTKMGSVEVFASGTRVGLMTFGLGPGDKVVRTTNFGINVEFQRQGLATGLVARLLASYPGWELAESGYEKTDEGNAFIETLRGAGVPYHRGSCYTPDNGCMCPLEGRRRG